MLIKSIRDSGSKHDVVVLISDNVSQETRDAFVKEGAILRIVPNIPNPYKVSILIYCEDYAMLNITVTIFLESHHFILYFTYWYFPLHPPPSPPSSYYHTYAINSSPNNAVAPTRLDSSLHLTNYTSGTFLNMTV